MRCLGCGKTWREAGFVRAAQATDSAASTSRAHVPVSLLLTDAFTADMGDLSLDGRANYFYGYRINSA
jgi:hypothetical protein